VFCPSWQGEREGEKGRADWKRIEGRQRGVGGGKEKEGGGREEGGGGAGEEERRSVREGEEGVERRTRESKGGR